MDRNALRTALQGKQYVKPVVALCTPHYASMDDFKQLKPCILRVLVESGRSEPVALAGWHRLALAFEASLAQRAAREGVTTTAASATLRQRLAAAGTMRFLDTFRAEVANANDVELRTHIDLIIECLKAL
jgi:hypothetical protein